MGFPQSTDRGCGIGPCEAEIPETRQGRREGVAVDRILGQILRQTVWDQLESRCSTSWQTTLTTGHCCWWRAVSCPAWPLGRALLAAHALDPSLRVVSTEGNPDTPPRNEQQHTNDNDEELERPGQQRRGLARRVVRLPPPSADAGPSKAQSRKEGLACPRSSQWQLQCSGRSD